MLYLRHRKEGTLQWQIKTFGSITRCSKRGGVTQRGCVTHHIDFLKKGNPSKELCTTKMRFHKNECTGNFRIFPFGKKLSDFDSRWQERVKTAKTWESEE